MRDIYLVNSKPHPRVNTIVIGQIEHVPIIPQLKRLGIDLDDIRASCDSVIFTSQNGIISLMRAIKKDARLEVFKQLDAFIIGAFSAKLWREIGGNEEYVGDKSSGKGFAKEIAPLLKERHPVYFRAARIVSSMDEILLAARVDLKQVIAYKNQPKTCDMSEKPRARSILIFTSPSHYGNFKKNFGWDGSYLAIAIGISTFSAFDADVDAVVSPVCSIEGCIEFATKIQGYMP